MYHSILYLFFSQLAVGGLLCVLLVPPSAGRSFFRFCGALSLILLVLGIISGPYPLALLAGPFNGRALSLLFLALSALAALFFVIAVIQERAALQKPFLATASLLGITGLVFDGLHSLESGLASWAPLLTALYFLCSAVFLGSVIFSMILGHWYLVVPTLPIRPLRSLTLVMLISVVVKILLASVTMYLFWNWGDVTQRETIATFSGIGGFFLWARVLFGFLGPLVVAIMTWETVKINSTQSATGLLYVATIFAIIGEILSKHIFKINAIPI